MNHVEEIVHDVHATARPRRRRDERTVVEGEARHGAMVAAVPMMIRG